MTRASARKQWWTRNWQRPPAKRPRQKRRSRKSAANTISNLRSIDPALSEMPSTYPVELPDVSYFTRQVLCREGCPVRTDSGGYVQAIAEGRYEDAYIIARTPNPFASICGRVCAAPCEAKCRRGALDASVSIRALKRFVCEKFGVESESFDLGRVYPQLSNPRRERVGGGGKAAVIGHRPAGVVGRYELAWLEFQPGEFEAHDI